MRHLPPIVRTCAILFLLAVLPIPAMAGDRTAIKPDPFQSDRYDVVDSHGNRVGIIKKDALDSRRLQIFTGDGELTHIKPSPLPTPLNRYDAFNRDGDENVTIKKDPLRDDRYRFKGKTIRPDVLRPDRRVFEK